MWLAAVHCVARAVTLDSCIHIITRHKVRSPRAVCTTCGRHACTLLPRRCCQHAAAAMRHTHYYHRQVPKVLGVLRREWAPAALAVSFKLETDEQLLVHKVRG